MRRRGFTLIEILVALSLSALVVLLAHQVFGAVVDGSERVRAARRTLDRTANSRRWLVEAFGSLAVGAPQGGSFEGLPGRVQFTTWRIEPARGFASVRVDLSARGGRLMAVLDSRDSVALADSVAAVAFDYLLDLGAQARWVQEWLSPVTAPLAVRLRLAHAAVQRGDAAPVDTLLFLIGSRG